MAAWYQALVRSVGDAQDGHDRQPPVIRQLPVAEVAIASEPRRSPRIMMVQVRNKVLEAYQDMLRIRSNDGGACGTAH